MLALLRFVENPRDRVSGFRLMQLLPSVGPTSAQRVLDFIVEAVDPSARSLMRLYHLGLAAKTGVHLLRLLGIWAQGVPVGPPNWSALVSRTNCTSTASMKMPSSGVRI